MPQEKREEGAGVPAAKQETWQKAGSELPNL